ncbi:MAG: rRNA maturation RNase YbeY [Synechococcus sp.]|nr:rRNA maturation RNase YbeY [Synechococcus sp.]
MSGAAAVELDLAYQGPDPQLLPQDPLGEERWSALLSHWLGQLQAELPAHLQASAYSLGLQLCDDDTIAALNGEWRGKPQPTDVLSFAAQEEAPLQLEGVPLELGDIVISLPTAERQAPEHGHGVGRELLFLASHGLLHLLGWDHPDEAALAAMLSRQQALLDGAAL